MEFGNQKPESEARIRNWKAESGIRNLKFWNPELNLESKIQNPDFMNDELSNSLQNV